MSKLLQIPDRTRTMLKEMSDKRRKKEELVWTMGGIVTEMVIAQYKKEADQRAEAVE